MLILAGRFVYRFRASSWRASIIRKAANWVRIWTHRVVPLAPVRCPNGTCCARKASKKSPKLIVKVKPDQWSSPISGNAFNFQRGRIDERQLIQSIGAMGHCWSLAVSWIDFSLMSIELLNYVGIDGLEVTWLTVWRFLEPGLSDSSKTMGAVFTLELYWRDYNNREHLCR